MKPLKLIFGDTAPLVSEQIKEQRNIENEITLGFNLQAAAILTCLRNNLISDKDRAKAEMRLMSNVLEYIGERNQTIL